MTLFKFTCIDRKLISIPFAQLRMSNLDLVSAIIVVPISFVSSRLWLSKSVELILLFQLGIVILIQLVESYSIVSTFDIIIDLNNGFDLRSLLNCSISTQ